MTVAMYGLVSLVLGVIGALVLLGLLVWVAVACTGRTRVLATSGLGLILLARPPAFAGAAEGTNGILVTGVVASVLTTAGIAVLAAAAVVACRQQAPQIPPSPASYRQS